MSSVRVHHQREGVLWNVVGGGFISVPFMVWSNVKMHQAVATSAALGFPIAAAVHASGAGSVAAPATDSDAVAPLAPGSP